MTKRTTQSSTVVVPASVAHTSAGVAPATAKAAAAAEVQIEGKAQAVVAKVEAEEAAPVAEQTVIAAAAPLAMVDVAAEPAATAAQDTGAASDDDNDDATPYIVGGVLLAGGILAVALAGNDDNDSAPPAPPAPPPTNTVTISTPATAAVNENVAAGAAGVVVLDVNATANGAAPTFALSGADAALFTINATTGEIRFVNSPNFEATPTKTTFNVTVTASSAASGNIPAATATQNVVITLNNVNEAPTFASGATRTVSFAENSTAAVIVDGATDQDANTTLTYTLTGADAGLFAVNAQTGVVTFRNAPDFEATPTRTTFNFNLVATDNATPALSTTQAVTVNLTNVNEAPTFTAATRTVTVAENFPTVGAIATVQANDPDAGSAAPTFTLTGADAALFRIVPIAGTNQANIQFVSSPDFEATPARNTLTFNVVATDASGASSTQAFTVNVTNVNEAPTFATGITRTVTVAENVAAGTVISGAPLTANDPEGSPLTYSISGGNSSLFTVNAQTGAVTINGSPNFEATPVLTFTLTATETGNPANAVSQTVVVNVTNVNEAPSVTVPAAAVSFAENQAVGTTVFTATTSDPDAGATRTLSLTGPDANLFAINQTTGAVTFVASPNFEAARTSFTVSVVATDNGGIATTSAPVTVNITNVNEAPTVAVSSTTVSFAENQAVGTTVVTATSTDPDAGATRTLSLTGPDASLFTINQTTGAVTFVASPNFEATPTRNTLTFSVVSTDQGGLTSTSAPVTVNVTDVNEPSTVTVPTAAVSFAENQAVGTTVFTATTSDPDAGATRTLSLTGPDANLFAINQTTGAVTFLASPNFEAARTSFTVSVVSTDNGGLVTTSAPVTVNVTNVNENPTFATATRTVPFQENTPVTTAVLTGGATDPDANATLTYSITGADAALFTVNATTGAVTFRASPDFEATPARNTLNFNLVATDQGGLAATQQVTVNVTNDPSDDGVVLIGVQNLTALNGDVRYLESAGTANTTTITNFGQGSTIGQGDTITVDVPTSNYSFFNNGADLVIQFANNGVVNQITLVGAVPANSFIFNEFTAEQALGYDFFRPGSNVQAPPAAANTIDGPGSQPSYNAANAAVTYTENAGVANTTTISNFTADDRIVVQGASSGYTFFNNGADLVIQFANNGVVNQITLQGAVNPNAFVFNEATAEAAVGADFFRYA